MLMTVLVARETLNIPKQLDFTSAHCPAPPPKANGEVRTGVGDWRRERCPIHAVMVCVKSVVPEGSPECCQKKMPLNQGTRRITDTKAMKRGLRLRCSNRTGSCVTVDGTVG